MEEESRDYPKVAQESLGHNYRMERILEVRRLLEQEIHSRKSLYNKYKKATNTLSAIDIALLTVGLGSTVASVGLLSSIIGAPAAMPVQAVGIVSGVLGAVGKFVERRLMIKVKKHNDIVVLARAKLGSVVERVSKALEDGMISDEDFRMVMEEHTQFIHMKESIREKSRKSVTAKMKEHEKQELFADAKAAARRSLIGKVES